MIISIKHNLLLLNKLIVVNKTYYFKKKNDFVFLNNKNIVIDKLYKK